jgi:hypothetical protein
LPIDSRIPALALRDEAGDHLARHEAGEVLLIVDLLRPDDDALRRAGEGGVKDAGTRRQRRAAGEPVF